MDIKPTEEELNKLNEAFSHLADLISDEINPDKTAIEKVLQSAGLNKNHQWMRNVLEQACPLLERAHNDIQDTEKKTIVDELEALGLKRFAAIFTYDQAKPKPLSAEPPLINFGCLKIGEGANTTITVSGGIVDERKVKSNRRLKVSVFQKSSGPTLVKIQISPGNAGELFEDELFLPCNKGDLRIPISARWEKSPEEPSLLSWCPLCAQKVKKKSLFFNRYTKQYECFYCKHIFPYPDKGVDDYNNTHK